MNPTEELKAMEQYLIRMSHTRQTIRSYNYAISNFLYSNPNAERYMYKDVLNYFSNKAVDCKNTDTRNCMLAAVKKYYDYLVYSGKRDDHPCRRLILKKRTIVMSFIRTYLSPKNLNCSWSGTSATLTSK